MVPVMSWQKGMLNGCTKLHDAHSTVVVCSISDGTKGKGAIDGASPSCTHEDGIMKTARAEGAPGEPYSASLLRLGAMD
jgi:hypothetical protein